jgi:uncharacterized membrane protein HdeD (DUF308 family)
LAIGFGFLTLFGAMNNKELAISMVSVFLLLMGIVDSVSALYASVKKHGWINSVVDALVDIAAALSLLFFAKNNITTALIIISVYTVVSGLIDVFHGFLSTVDPTDRFIRILVGVLGCVIGVVILNAGDFEMMTFIRFFGAYMLLVGATSLIYGVHNRSQDVEDSVARSQALKGKKKGAAKKITKKSTKKSKK